MVVLGGIVGAILGFGVGLLISEVIFSNPPNGPSGSSDWQLLVDVAFIVMGALAGSSFARWRFTNRNVKPS